jgi:hypothetical protein
MTFLTAAFSVSVSVVAVGAFLSALGSSVAAQYDADDADDCNKSEQLAHN